MPAETGNGIEKTGGGLPFFVTIAVTVVLVGLTAYTGIMLTREFDRIASIWLANGVLLSFLLCNDKSR